MKIKIPIPIFGMNLSLVTIVGIILIASGIILVIYGLLSDVE